jgi:hypothetical protein
VSALWLRITDEPVLATTLVGAVIGLAVTFGAPISDDQKLAIIGLVTAGLAVFARSKVSPV